MNEPAWTSISGRGNLRTNPCNIGIVVAVVLLAATSPHAQQSPRAQADLILVNGRVYTLDPAMPWAEAVAVSGSRISAVGRSAEIRGMSGQGTRVIDLNGAVALPGFNDAHVHIDSTGALLVGVNLLDVHEPAAFTTRIREAAGRLPEGSWITRGEWGAYEQWAAGSPGAAQPGASAEGPFTPGRDLIDAVTPPATRSGS